MEILNINWSNAFAVSGLGIYIVLIVLTMLVFVLNGFSRFFIEKKQLTTERQPVATNHNVSSEAETAAIVVALQLFHQEVHDEESYIITISKKTTLWNSKVFGLINLPR